MKEYQLKINGNDLISIGFKGKDIGTALQKCLDAVMDGKVENNFDDLISSSFVFSEKKLEKIPIPENFSFQKEIVLRRSDIDFNNHVHNLFYLDFALEALPDEVYKNEQFSSIRITYKNAITEGEQVVARYAKLDAKHIVCIFSHDVVKTLVELG